MLFKNLYIFAFEKPLDISNLEEGLKAKQMTEISSHQRKTIGWVKPYGINTNALAITIKNATLISMGKSEKILPSSVIVQTLNNRIEEIELNEMRKVSGRERKELREDIEHELLPRAFNKYKKINAFITDQFMVIDTPTPSVAEEFAKLLRKTLGSLPVTLISTVDSTPVSMLSWLKQAKLPEPFALGFECELKNQGDDRGVASFKQHDLTLDEIKTSLEAGKFATKLAIEWDEKISFVLTEDFQIKKVKFLDIFTQTIEAEDPQSFEEHADIVFTLMSGELVNMINNLIDELGGLDV